MGHESLSPCLLEPATGHICRSGDKSAVEECVVPDGGSTGGIPLCSGYVADDLCPQYVAHCHHLQHNRW